MVSIEERVRATLREQGEAIDARPMPRLRDPRHEPQPARATGRRLVGVGIGAVAVVATLATAIAVQNSSSPTTVDTRPGDTSPAPGLRVATAADVISFDQRLAVPLPDAPAFGLPPIELLDGAVVAAVGTVDHRWRLHLIDAAGSTTTLAEDVSGFAVSADGEQVARSEDLGDRTRLVLTSVRDRQEVELVTRGSYYARGFTQSGVVLQRSSAGVAVWHPGGDVSNLDADAAVVASRPNGSEIVTVDGRGCAAIVELQKDDSAPRVPTGVCDVRGAEFSSDGVTVAMRTGGGGDVLLYDTTRRTKRQLDVHAHDMAWDGDRLLVIPASGPLRVLACEATCAQIAERDVVGATAFVRRRPL